MPQNPDMFFNQQQVVASVCCSETAFGTHILLEQMSPESRRNMCEILLSIVENIPSDLPKIQFSQPPAKGNCSNGNEGWWGWIRDRRL
jgi:hypothetical protein